MSKLRPNKGYVLLRGELEISSRELLATKPEDLKPSKETYYIEESGVDTILNTLEEVILDPSCRPMVVHNEDNPESFSALAAKYLELSVEAKGEYNKKNPRVTIVQYMIVQPYNIIAFK